MEKIALLFIISLFINGVFGDEVSVMEGDSVTLHTDTVIQALHDVTIMWKFGAQKNKIAQINKAKNANTLSKYFDVPDGRFKDRLQVDNQTGDLNITNIRTTHSGQYIVDIHVGSEETHKSFDVKGVSNPESDQLKSVSVKDGDSVTLHPDVPDIKTYDEILWRFQGIRIAQFNKSTSEILEDKRFRDKPQLDVKTGSLKIKNLRMDLSGLYEVEISSSSGYTIHQSFTVTVSGEVKPVSVMKGDAVTIKTDVPDIKTYDQILLLFGCDDKIAEVKKQNKQFTLSVYGEVRDRLKLNDQTGDLTITNIRNEDGGLYQLKMSSRRRTIQRRFSVNISEPALSPGAIAGICVFFILLAAAAAAAGVIYHRRMIAEALKQQEKLNVYVGESVHMKTEVTDIKRDDVIEWRFGETLIAEINLANDIFSTYDGNSGLFRDKLKLNDQTGDLTIKDSREKHTGVYKLTIIRGGKTSYKRLIVSVRWKTEELQVYERESVDLKTEVKDIKKGDVIEWRFGDNETLIAKINPANSIFRTYDGDDDEFRDKLKLNHQTGDLNINDITWKHEGNYLLKIIRDGKTSYKRFSVSVSGTELNMNKRNVVVLKTEVTDIQEVDVIEWRFGETLIAEINPANKSPSTYYDGDDGEFRDKLKLNDQTGDLMINDIREEHAGDYTLRIIRGGKPSDKRFRVFVRAVRVNVKVLQVNEEDSEDLKTEVKDIKTVDVMEWRFGRKETLIAKINPANKIFSTYDGNYDLFRDKLTLNPQTGDLNIKNITWEHCGVYTLKIIRGGKTSYRRFSVSVGFTTLEVNKGSSVDLKTKLTDIQRFEKMEWRFKGALIAEINPADNIFNTYNVDTDLFRDKLELNRQTGDLTINDIREEHAGEYTMLIIRGINTSDRRFNVSVSAGGDSVRRRGGDSVGIVMEPLLKNSSQ